MYCNASGTLNTLQWYKQEPGGRLVLLVMLVKGGEVKEQDRLTARFGERRQHGSLHVTATRGTDSGTYFCAATRCSPTTCCLSPNLALRIHKELLSPSVAQKLEKAEATLSAETVHLLLLTATGRV